MKCKHCQQELEAGVTVCPDCGTDNTLETEEKVETAVAAENVETVENAEAVEDGKQTEEKSAKNGVGKIAIAFVVLVALLMVLIVMVLGDGKTNDEVTQTDGSAETTEATEAETTEATTPADTGEDNATCKGSYTVSDDVLLTQLDTVVATLGGDEMTVADLQVYYWMQVRSFLSEYYYYVLYGYMNFDYSLPLDTQICDFDETLTWQQYFIDCAINCWQEFTAMAQAAEEQGIEMDADLRADLEGMEASLQEMAESNGYADTQELLEASFGPGATYEAYARYMEIYYMGYSYYAQMYEEAQPTAEEVEAYFHENAEYFETNYYVTAEDKVVDVRHILIMPQGGTTDLETGSTTYSDEEWQTCYDTAEDILNQWLAGEMTEDSFAQLANTYSEDGGSNTAGGLYEDVYVGQMVTEFNDWCFDEARQIGDYGLVQTTYGWHIMYFVDSGFAWFSYAEEELIYERVTTLMDKIVESYGVYVDYNSMILGYMDIM